MPVIPDLLHAEPRLWLREPELRQVLTFAFASGSGADAFELALEHIELAPSRFSPDLFAKDLFVEELVARCLQFSRGARMVKPRRRSLVPLITNPPDDERTIAFRHAILAELVEKPELAASLERAWAAVEDVFGALEVAAPLCRVANNARSRVARSQASRRRSGSNRKFSIGAWQRFLRGQGGSIAAVTRPSKNGSSPR